MATSKYLQLLDALCIVLALLYYLEKDKSMPVAIKIISLAREKMVLEPIPNTNDNYNSLSQEVSALKARLRELGLIENEDYKMVNSNYHSRIQPDRFEFSGPSLVLRALCVIPTESFEQQQDYYNHEKDKAAIQTNVKMNAVKFATKITEKECTVFDKKFADQQHKDLFEALKLSIEEIHKKFIKPSSVVDQLNHDIAYITSLNNDDSFGFNRYVYLNAALYFAIETEKAARTIKSTGFLSNNSVLAPEYITTFDTYGAAYGRKKHPELGQLTAFYSQNVKPNTSLSQAAERLHAYR